MNNKKSALQTSLQIIKTSREESTNASMPSSRLMRLFEDQLKEAYWASRNSRSLKGCKTT